MTYNWRGAAFGAGLAILFSAAVLSEPCGTIGTALAQQPGTSNSLPGENDARPLEAGKPIEREIAGGQKHYYKIALDSGQYSQLVVEQKGIDVIVTLFDSGGKKLIEVNSPVGAYRPERLSITADTSSHYRLEVCPAQKDAGAGRYEVKIAELRMATAQDQTRVMAETADSEGDLLERQGTAESLKNAIEKREKALRLFKAAGDRQGEGSTLHRLGLTYFLLGENQKALGYYNQALSLRRDVGDRGGEGATLNGFGMVYNALGEKQKALDYFNQALPLIRSVGDRSGEGATLNGLGVVYSAMGENQKALDCFNQRLQLNRAVSDRNGEAAALNNLGNVYDEIGERQKALDHFNQSLAIRRSVGDRRGEAVTLHNIGLIYSALGENQKALDHYNQSLPLRRAVGDRRGEANTLNGIGTVYESLGDKQRALDYFNQSLALRRAVGDRGGEAYTLNNIGLIHELLGDSQKALDYYNQSLSLNRSVGDRRGEATTLNNIGVVYKEMGDNQKALDYYNQSLPLSRVAGDHKGEAMTLNNIGSVYESLGAEQKAVDYFNQSLTLSRAAGDHRIEASALFGMAKVEAAQGKLFEAHSAVESTLSIIESIRTKVVSPELRSSYFGKAKNYYEFSIDLLMRLHKLRPDEGYDRAALQRAERARARSLLERLAEARLEIRSGADPALVERERSLRQLLNAKTERQMRLLNGKHTEEQAAEAANEIKALTSQYQDVEAEIRAKSPRYAALTQPQPLNSEEIQRQTLDDRTLLLEYFLGAERSYLWVASASSVKSYELPKRADIEAASLRVKKLITARATREEGESPERRRARITEAEARYWPEAARLSRMILGPAMSELKGKRLAIVPDGELQDVAFGALPAPQASSAGKINSKAPRSGDWMPLIAEHEIVSLPSVSALAVLRKETAGRRPAAKTVAVLADPVFDKDDERIKLTIADKSGKESPSEATAPAKGDLTRATEEVIGAGGAISRLPFSRAEAEAILSLAPKASSLKALDFNASRATATSAELSQYRIVHFATHGLLNRTHPELSGVVLSLVDRQGEPQDGFLQLHDVYNLDLPAELVVLSACQTGLGKAVWGEGLVGLTRGFIYAGSKRVVASLWGVQDSATAELMKRFYGAMLGEKQMRPAEALRAAQVEMWKQKRWRSPYYWGGFMLYGEW
jgi:CHAT domain-containing protein/tetratricopeptide (TPR) repeat protein